MYKFSDEATIQARQAALDLQSLLRERAADAETNRRVSDESISALVDAGMFRMAAPRRVGGLCLSTKTNCEVVATLAQACASTAWVVCVSNSNSWLASLAPTATTNAVFADGVPLICGATAPTGRTELTPQGRKVSGRWGYLSGSSHADWAIFSLADKGPDGKPVGASAYVPMSDVVLDETWFVSGLSATASNTGVVEDKLLPDHLYVTAGPGPEERGEEAEATDFVAMVPQFRVFLIAVMVGIAESMVEAIVANAKKKGITYSTYRIQSTSQVVHKDLGEASAMVFGAREIMVAAARKIDAVALERRTMSAEERAYSRGQTALANQLLTAAAEKLMFIGGASAFALGNPLQRQWRDLNIAARHGISVPSLGFELAGRALLDVEGAITPSPELI